MSRAGGPGVGGGRRWAAFSRSTGYSSLCGGDTRFPTHPFDSVLSALHGSQAQMGPEYLREEQMERPAWTLIRCLFLDFFFSNIQINSYVAQIE